MFANFSILFNDTGDNVKGKVIGIYVLLIAANLAAWAWALIAFRDYPVLLGTAMLAYSFGLRHAFDADHIAAIDNVTRKLMQEGKRPVGVGLFFSLGHSTIVVGLSIAIAITATALQSQFDTFKTVGSVIGTSVSALFLFVIAFANMLVLISIYRTFRTVKSSGCFVEEDLDLVLTNWGVLGRLFRRFFRVIERSWQMYPLGVLFGLGFDTATEVGLLGISATQASEGLSIWSILVFPALFTAGMTLIDTTDSMLMLGAYGWAFVKPIRKLYYNLTITAVSVIVAVIVGGLETLNLIGGRLGLTDGGGFWGAIGALNDNFGILGYVIVGVFIASWIISYVVYRLNRYDDLNIRVGTP
ncbi:HoxN/HupN/NixA family nickel/cobalt transporter [Rhodoblastus sp.]|uniref:HoxN/HupN/NixA family nickel/cobalt transporter n=1 Tax=Rhodoblastus sp. TaxID=1962975 RepID=UPI003F97532F